MFDEDVDTLMRFSWVVERIVRYIFVVSWVCVSGAVCDVRIVSSPGLTLDIKPNYTTREMDGGLIHVA